MSRYGVANIYISAHSYQNANSLNRALLCLRDLRGKSSNNSISFALCLPPALFFVLSMSWPKQSLRTGTKMHSTSYAKWRFVSLEYSQWCWITHLTGTSNNLKNSRADRYAQVLPFIAHVLSILSIYLFLRRLQTPTGNYEATSTIRLRRWSNSLSS